MPPSPTPSPENFKPSHWDPLVIALVGAVCTIILVLSYHRILHHHCCAFQVSTLSGNQAQRRRLNEDNPDDPSQQFQSQGLDSYIARSLPITQFKKKSEDETNHGNNNNNSTDCAVCLGEFEEGEWIKHLPNCSHVFHVSCIDIWFQTHSSCPLCRADIFDLEHSYTLQETMEREDLQDEQRSLFEMLRSHILDNSSHRQERDLEN